MQNSILQIRSDHYGSNICRSKSDSALWRKDNERLKLDRPRKGSINLTVDFGIEKSITNIPDTKLQECCQLLNSESFLCNDKSFHGSLSKHTSLSLPAISSMSTFLVMDKFNESDNDIYTYRNIKACLDEEETILNQPSKTENLQSDLQCSMNENSIIICKIKSEHERDKNNLKEDITVNNTSKIAQPCKGIVNSQLQTSNIETSDCITQNCEDLHKENKSNLISIVNTHVRRNLTSRPTLADDSKLVKMSLLTNPVNLMQSNVQLLNRSRNFLNFITEKSTNIMEKALLPQHLAMRYNHVSKSVETDTVKEFYTTNERPSRDTTFKSDIDLTINFSNDTLNVASCTVKRDHDNSEDKMDDVTNSGNEVDPFVSIKKNKIHDLEEETASNEKKHYIPNKSDIYKLDCNTTNGQAKHDFSLIEADGKISCLQVEKLHDNMCKTELSDIHLLNSDTSKYSSLEHPLHYMLLTDYNSLKLKYSKLLEKMESLEKLNGLDREVQVNTDTYNLQVENLEKAVTKLTTDLNASMVMQEALKNECTAVNKEKENMVMKYVISEKQLIDSQRYV